MSNFEHPLNTDSNARLTTSVWDDNVLQWMMKIQNYVQSSAGIWIPLALDENGYLKASVKDSALPTGAATQATLASVLAKIIAAPSTEAKQDDIISALSTIAGHVDGLEGFSDGIEGLLTALNGYVDGLEGFTDGIEGKLDTLNSKNFATEATLVSILAKIIAAPSTEAKQDTIIAALANTNGYIDGIEGILNGLATSGNQVALAALIDGVEGKMDTLNAKDFATQTTLAAILAKLIASPATEAKQTTLNDTIAAIIAGSSLASVKMGGSKTEDITFHDAATVAANGTIFSVGGYKSLLVEITGTSTSRAIAFKGRSASGVDRAISGVNLNGYGVEVTTSGTDELWSFDNIAGLTSIFMKLEAVAGGNVTVKGRAVA